MSGSLQKGTILGVFVITCVTLPNRYNQQVPNGWDHVWSWEPLYSCVVSNITKHRHVGHGKRVQVTFYNHCHTHPNLLFIDTWLKQRFSFITSDLRLDSVRLHTHMINPPWKEMKWRTNLWYLPISIVKYSKFSFRKYLTFSLIWDRL